MELKEALKLFEGKYKMYGEMGNMVCLSEAVRVLMDYENKPAQKECSCPEPRTIVANGKYPYTCGSCGLPIPEDKGEAYQAKLLTDPQPHPISERKIEKLGAFQPLQYKMMWDKIEEIINELNKRG